MIHHIKWIWLIIVIASYPFSTQAQSSEDLLIGHWTCNELKPDHEVVCHLIFEDDHHVTCKLEIDADDELYDLNMSISVPGTFSLDPSTNYLKCEFDTEKTVENQIGPKLKEGTEEEQAQFKRKADPIAKSFLSDMKKFLPQYMGPLSSSTINLSQNILKIKETTFTREGFIFRDNEIAIKPEFSGGDAALARYVHNHIRYPMDAAVNGIEGRVILQIVVKKNGKIGNIKVVRSVDKDLDKEAKRIAKSLPRFTPGKLEDGTAVNSWYMLSVPFKLKY